MGGVAGFEGLRAGGASERGSRRGAVARRTEDTGVERTRVASGTSGAIGSGADTSVVGLAVTPVSIVATAGSGCSIGPLRFATITATIAASATPSMNVRIGFMSSPFMSDVTEKKAVAHGFNG
jgi:hypothetical protein